MEVMDIFVEHIVERKNNVKTLLVRILVVALAVLICVATAMYIPSIAIFIWAAIIYGVYKFFASQNVEFEYIVTNGEMDVDKIIAKAKRKRIVSVKAKDFELLARANDPSYKSEFESASIKTKLDASSGVADEGLYFCIFTNKQFGRTRLIFNPDDRMLTEFIKYAPRQVHR